MESRQIPQYFVVLRFPRKTFSNFQYFTQANKTCERILKERLKGLDKLVGHTIKQKAVKDRC